MHEMLVFNAGLHRGKMICGPQVNMSRLSMIYVDMKCSVIYYCDTKGGGGKTYERTDSVT